MRFPDRYQNPANTKSHNYDLVEAKRGHQYYVYASAPMNYANVHGKGNYCP